MEQREGYKKTEIGWIPEEWNVAKLEDTADKTDRYSIAGGPFGSDLKSEHYTESGVRIVQLQNMGDGAFLNDYHIFTSEDKADELRKCNIYPGEIIIAKMAEPLVRACIIPKNDNRFLMCSDGIRLKVNHLKFNNNYVLYTINSKYFRKIAEANGTGTTRLRIGLKTLRTLPILSPPLPEQQKIASILTTVDDKISSIENQIQQTEQLKKGLMEKLLTEGIGHTEFKDTEIGRIPKGWDVKSIGELCEVKGRIGYRGYTTKDLVKEGKGALAIGATQININNRLDFFNPVYISWEKYVESPEIMCALGDVLIVQRGSSIGKVALIEDLPEKATINPSMILLKNAKMVNEFLFFSLNSPYGRKSILKLISTTSIPMISQKQVSGIKLPLPTLEEQKQIASILSTVDDKIDVLNQKKSEYQTLKKGLSQQLLTGQMRVKV